MGVGFGALLNPICVGVWDLLQECPIAARLPVASMGDISVLRQKTIATLL